MNRITAMYLLWKRRSLQTRIARDSNSRRQNATAFGLALVDAPTPIDEPILKSIVQRVARYRSEISTLQSKRVQLDADYAAWSRTLSEYRERRALSKHIQQATDSIEATQRQIDICNNEISLRVKKIDQATTDLGTGGLECRLSSHWSQPFLRRELKLAKFASRHGQKLALVEQNIRDFCNKLHIGDIEAYHRSTRRLAGVLTLIVVVLTVWYFLPAGSPTVKTQERPEAGVNSRADPDTALMLAKKERSEAMEDLWAYAKSVGGLDQELVKTLISAGTSDINLLDQIAADLQPDTRKKYMRYRQAILAYRTEKIASSMSNR